MEIKTDRIIHNPQQPRKAFSAVELRELANSIKENGLIQDITVEGPDENGIYTLIDGERRWRAIKLIGQETISAKVRPALNGSGEQERAMLALVANIQRADLSPVEEGRAYEELHKMGISNAKIAHRIGVSNVRVATRRALLDLEPEIQDLIDAGLLPIDQRAVVAIQSIPDEKRVEFARKLARPGLRIKTVQTAAEKLCAALRAELVSAEPAMHFAAKKAGSPNLPQWDALRQLGKLPPWTGVVDATNYTCQTCVLRREASSVICGQCPAVVMLAKMIDISHQVPA